MFQKCIQVFEKNFKTELKFCPDFKSRKTKIHISNQDSNFCFKSGHPVIKLVFRRHLPLFFFFQNTQNELGPFLFLLRLEESKVDQQSIHHRMVTAVIQAPSSSSMTESTSSNSTSVAIQAARTISDVFEPLDREATVGGEEAERLPSRFRTERQPQRSEWGSERSDVGQMTQPWWPPKHPNPYPYLYPYPL